MKTAWILGTPPPVTSPATWTRTSLRTGAGTACRGYFVEYLPPTEAMTPGGGLRADHTLAVFHAAELRYGLLAWPKREAVAALATLDAAHVSPLELRAS